MDSFKRAIEYLTIIAWNIYIGSGVKEARAALKKLIEEHNPEVFALMESTSLYGDLENLGYQVVQLKPTPDREGNRPGDANIALLVRNDIKIKGRFVLRMKTFWRGPKHGWPQDPRVYRWVKIKWKGRTWKIGAAHTPFGTAARAESRWKLIQWFRNTLPGRPTVLVLDANMSLAEFEKTIAGPAGADADGHHIDLTAALNASLIKMVNLGRRDVSDHPAMKYEYLPD